MRPQGATVDAVIAHLAYAAHGVVTRAELLAAGITIAAIKSRMRSGALLPEFLGVYRVGHRAPSLEARYMAAVKACGEGACLRGEAAGHLLGMLKGEPPEPEVVAPHRRRIPGVRTVRARHLDPLDTTTYRGIPTTTAPRTLVDLAARLPLGDLARAAHEAEVRHHVRPAAIAAALARRPNAPGARNVRRIIEGDAPLTLSRLERAFLAVLRAESLPLPNTNRPAGGGYVDCRWPEHGLTVELDSYRFHHSRHAWEMDRRRARQAHDRGDEFRRYTWGDVTEDRTLMLRELRRLLLRRGPPGS